VLNIPQDFVVSKFLNYAGYPKFKRLSNVYEGCCPICREGNSWGRKRRLFYIVKKNIICCHNCGWYSQPYKWIKKVTGSTDIELISEIKSFDSSFTLKIDHVDLKKPIVEDQPLPENCINLFDPVQMEFYSNNIVVQVALQYVKARKLDTCINPPPALYVSLIDKVHKNRLVIPFYYDGKIVFYQTRSLFASDLKSKPKYLSKIGGEKSLFNIDNISDEQNNIYIFEGPIDSCFVKNAVGITGIQERSTKTFSQLQHKQLSRYPHLKRIFVLDSQWQDDASLRKSKILLKQGELVFIWPEKIGKIYKDFNDMCVKLGRNSVSHEFIKKNTYEGLTGIVELSKLEKSKIKLQNR
jgi:hypothetical protein